MGGDEQPAHFVGALRGVEIALGGKVATHVVQGRERHPVRVRYSRAWRGDDEVSLSAKEFRLLEVFMRHPGEVLSRYQLLEQAWDYDYENRSNIVDVYVRYLRDKIDRPFGVCQLETVRGSGYRLAS